MDMTPKAEATKEKIDKLYFIKTKTMCTKRQEKPQCIQHEFGEIGQKGQKDSYLV